MEGYNRVTAALSENVLTVSVLISVFLLPGVQTECHSTHKGINITAPKHINALSGSCLLIPCSFTDQKEMKVDGRMKTSGIWIRSTVWVASYPRLVVYNSSWSKNKYEMKMIGNLREKNCTTVFSNIHPSHTDRYFFSIENGLLKSFAVCDPVLLIIRDSPWRPRLQISGDVKENNSVTVTCSAPTPCPQAPPELTLNLQPNPLRQMERNTDGTFITTIQQNVTLSYRYEGYNIICSARYPVNAGKHNKSPNKGAKTKFTVSFSYAPKETSAFISSSVDNWVKLRCSSRANPPISVFTWFKNTSDGAMKIAEGESYGFRVTEEGIYYCAAMNDVGSQTSPEISLTVKDKGIEPTHKAIERKGAESSQIQISVVAAVSILILVCLLKVVMWFLKTKTPTPPQVNLDSIY
ncbi:myelin-associated glycoprotein-like [Gambusia affinis]|uniref:myelin-associated glycoprotein-like n=1 Tax=Gambusia affinis TaxID=33528 RepID=UPI001CDB7D6F|nr:myelin-associated glycoprotein-like [Gambusia affinis]